MKDKAAAFREFFRVLKPGGRISHFEPINSYGYPPPDYIFSGCDVTPVMDLALKVRAYLDTLRPPNHSMLDFDERGLVAWVEQAGFREVHLELHIDVEPVPPISWDVLMKMSPNPLVPSNEELFASALTPDEAARLTAYLRPLFEGGQSVQRLAVSYLWAAKGT